MRLKLPDWQGRTVVCIASGPSLTAEDCELVRESGYAAVVTNSSFRLVPWAAIVFGFDSRWWQYKDPATGITHMQEVKATCPNARCLCGSAVFQGAESVYSSLPMFANSGAMAVAIAVAAKAAKVILLGYDCQKTGGKMHWHADHGKGLGNGKSIEKWPRQMQLASEYARNNGTKVVNASRETALKWFERASLESLMPMQSLAA